MWARGNTNNKKFFNIAPRGMRPRKHTARHADADSFGNMRLFIHKNKGLCQKVVGKLFVCSKVVGIKCHMLSYVYAYESTCDIELEPTRRGQI